MDSIKKISWFKNEIEPKLKGYRIEYRHFSEGDFGSLNQIDINSEKKGGNIDFWSTGWLGIFLIDYQKDEELINVLFNPVQEEEKEDAIQKLLKFIV